MHCKEKPLLLPTSTLYVYPYPVSYGYKKLAAIFWYGWYCFFGVYIDSPKSYSEPLLAYKQRVHRMQEHYVYSYKTIDKYTIFQDLFPLNSKEQCQSYLTFILSFFLQKTGNNYLIFFVVEKIGILIVWLFLTVLGLYWKKMGKRGGYQNSLALQ